MTSIEDYKTYEERVKSIQQDLEAQIARETGSLRHHIISLCVNRYLPSYDHQVDIDELVRNVLVNQSLAWAEQDDYDLLKKLRVKGDIDESPCTYVSFHLASYRLGLVYLLAQKQKIALVASKEVIDSQFNKINEIHQFLTGYPISLIDANQSGALFRMRKYLEEGGSLFIYADGNTGADGMTTNNRNLQDIRFLASSIRVRKGASVVSYLCRVPLIPVIPGRDTVSHIPSIEIERAIYPREDEKRDEYILRSLGELYRYLELILLSYPDTWEGWLYIYKFASRSSIGESLEHLHISEITPSSHSLKFNWQEYSIYRNPENPLIIHRASLEAYPLPHLQVVHLDDPNYLQTLPNEDLSQLIYRRILL